MTANTPEQPPPHIQLIQMGAAVTSRTVCVAAKLGLADQLASGPKSASATSCSDAGACTIAASINARSSEPGHSNRAIGAAFCVD